MVVLEQMLYLKSAGSSCRCHNFIWINYSQIATYDLLSSPRTGGHLVRTRPQLCGFLHIPANVRIFFFSGMILGLRPANERRRYFVTTSLIGWEQNKNQPWSLLSVLELLHVV